MQFVYALINFCLLAAIIWLFGRKTISKIFRDRKERIDKDLDEIGIMPEIPEAEEVEIPESRLTDDAVREELASRQEKLDALEAAFRKSRENLHREALLKTRQKLVSRIVSKALSDMTGEDFKNEMRGLEDKIADRILSLIELTPGDKLYLSRKKVLYVSLISAEPLKDATVIRIRSAVEELLAPTGYEPSFLVRNDKNLIGGFRLRIGDTIYDYTVKNRLYLLEDALNRLPITETDSESMLRKMEDAVSSIDIDVDVFQVGRVTSVSDGICWMDGLIDIMYGELVEIRASDRMMYGMVMDVHPDKVGCMIFGRFQHIETFAPVRRLNRMVQTPVGEELLGRVISPMGFPIDGKGRIWSDESRFIECPAPAITDRQPVERPLETGIRAIDALVPIGKGQRELIIGDRQTGKTALAVDTIINQRGKDVYCIYVAIGQKETSVAALVAKLEEYGAMEYTTVVCASASDSASVQYIAPFVGAALGEYYMNNGKDSLVIYDDLSKHAVAYRELSLLLHRPAGREAYPGDIFYLHSRLLERAAQLSDEKGGGSMTALPIIETQVGDISAYIPTNVISITDGQIFLDTDLFNGGQRPAINVGLSVSRVGGAAQTKLMKQVSSNLRTGLAQYREYASFAQFGADVDTATKKMLDSGERMMAILRQDRYEPMPAWQQALLIFAVSNGVADNCRTDEVIVLDKSFIPWMKTNYPDICEKLIPCTKMSDDTRTELLAAIDEYKKEL